MDSAKLSSYKSAKKALKTTIILYFTLIGLAILIPVLLITLTGITAGSLAGGGLGLNTAVSSSIAGSSSSGITSIFGSYLILFAILFIAFAVISLLTLIFYIMSIARAYEGKAHDVLLILGFFIGILGFIGLFIKLGYVKSQIRQLESQEYQY